MEQFCGGTFWDSNITWYTDNPYFTPCFEKTVLTWTPCIFLLSCIPIEVFRFYHSKHKNIPWNSLNITKCIGLVLLMILKLCDLCYLLHQQRIEYEVHYADFVGSAVLFLTFVIEIWLTIQSKKYGLRSSGVQFIFWLIIVTCGGITYRTFINNAINQDDYSVPFFFVTYTIYYPIVVAELLLNCWADAAPRWSAAGKSSETPCPLKSSSFISQCIYAWMDPMVWKGFRRSLVTKDIWDLNIEEKSQYIVPTFDKHWIAARRKHAYSASYNNYDSNVDIKEPKQKTELSVLPSLFKAFGAYYVVACIIEVIAVILTFVNPQILNLMIDFVSGNEEVWKGYFYACLLFIIAFIRSILNADYFLKFTIITLRVRTALIATVYRKALKLSSAAKRKSTVGETVNMMSIDAQRLADSALFFSELWITPFYVIVALIFLWDKLGPSSLSGLAVIAVLVPFNVVISIRVKNLQTKQMQYKDERVKLITELLSGMKILKMYVWEPHFQKQIDDIRNKEVDILRSIALHNSVLTILWFAGPVLVAITSFATFVLSSPENILDANVAFVSIALINILRLPLSMMPYAISTVVQGYVSLKRINEYLNSEELDPSNVQHSENKRDPLVIKNGSFSWGLFDSIVLNDINLRVEKQSLVAIVGTVGAGKSSLLFAMLGEMVKLTGSVNTHGRIAYVAQQAWIQNATLKENIMFGKELNEIKYSELIDACALRPDLSILPAGDRTEIGEKGINLSGGQKQRVSLARAVYNDADIYLFDDPLSAVDSQVGKQIFEKVIGPKGLLQNKTRVLVTHGITYLPEVDHIVVLKDGHISEEGTYKHLLNKKGAFADFLMQHISEKEEVEDLSEIKQQLEITMGAEEFRRQLSRQRSRLSESLSDSSNMEDDYTGDFLMRHSASVSPLNHVEMKLRKSVEKLRSNSKLDENEVMEPLIGEKLIDLEIAETGVINRAVYWYYIKAFGVTLAVTTLICFVVYEAISICSNLWLSEWSNDPLSYEIPKRDMYLGVYAGLGITQSLVSGVADVFLLVSCAIASRSLHRWMLSRIVRAPMAFFDTTPLGRIISRFSKDIDIIDNSLPMQIADCMWCTFEVLATIFVICYSTPIFIVVIIPISILYYFIQRFYVMTSRQLRRIESIARSPIYSHFNETISGATTIRAFNQSDRFISESDFRVDNNQVPNYYIFVSNRWLAVRLEFIGNTLTFFAALFAVLGRDTLSPGLVGLCITYALQITGALNWGVRMYAEIETNIVAVERMKEYAEVEEEAPWDIPNHTPPKGWPDKGEVTFENYSVRYREGLDLVLKGVSCNINGGEKVGIVGRTGAGKSSLTLALFRLIEAASGRILIDGQEVGKLGLHDLRGQITIIPQDPVLFSGNLRMNLDPLGIYKDHAIWQALEHAHLLKFVKTLPNGLDHAVSEGGENLSVGQRQLVCLARALLRKTKLLVLDEATAAVDLETDDLIQKTIRTEFKECTVLTIAHRLNTIMDSDRVLLLSEGEIREFDTVDSLIKNKDSAFYAMAKDAGLVANNQGHST